MKLEMWKYLTITLALRDRIVGGIPTNEDLIKAWISANMPKATEEEKAKLAAKTVAELGDATEEKIQAMKTTFKHDDKGVFIEGRQLKAAFKESANILRDLLIKTETKGAKGEAKGDAKGEAKTNGRSRFVNLKSKLAERLYVEGEKVYLTRDGKPIEKPDGSEQKAIHVITAQGPRSALKVIDYVAAPAQLSFVIRYVNDGVIDRDLVDTLLEHMSWNGIGSDRSQGNGMFNVVSVREEGAANLPTELKLKSI